MHLMPTRPESHGGKCCKGRRCRRQQQGTRCPDTHGLYAFRKGEVLRLRPAGAELADSVLPCGARSFRETWSHSPGRRLASTHRLEPRGVPLCPSQSACSPPTLPPQLLSKRRARRGSRVLAQGVRWVEGREHSAYLEAQESAHQLYIPCARPHAKGPERPRPGLTQDVTLHRLASSNRKGKRRRQAGRAPAVKGNMGAACSQPGCSG